MNCNSFIPSGRSGKDTVRPNEFGTSVLLVNVVPGLTETSTVVCSSIASDCWFGSSGSLVPGVEAKIVTVDGAEVEGYGQRGELVVRSPSVTLGYLHNEKSTKETFVDGWMRTGDEAMVKVAPSGNEHIFITDRIKELIKVKVSILSPYDL
jgi:long-subunit acyl-CoA synthetase (AMP-forming)